MVTQSSRAPRPPMQVLDDPRRVRSALSPLRRRLLHELRQPASATGLAPRIGVTRQKINYHLKQLEEQGLIDLVEERPRRGFTERIFQTAARALVVDPEVLGEIGEDPAQAQDRFSSAYMIAAAARLLGEVGALRAEAEAAERRLLTVTQETEIHFRSPREVRAFHDELAGAIATLVARYHRPRAASSRSHRLLLAMHPTRNSKEAAEVAQKESDDG